MELLVSVTAAWLLCVCAAFSHSAPSAFAAGTGGRHPPPGRNCRSALSSTKTVMIRRSPHPSAPDDRLPDSHWGCAHDDMNKSEESSRCSVLEMRRSVNRYAGQ